MLQLPLTVIETKTWFLLQEALNTGLNVAYTAKRRSTDIFLIHSVVSMETPKRDPFPSYNFMGQNFPKRSHSPSLTRLLVLNHWRGPDASLVPCKVISTVQ